MSVSTSSPWPAGFSLDSDFELDETVWPTEGLSVRRHWKLARNCSLAPRQLLVVFVALSTLSLAVALFFWLMGVRLVMPFACLELMALGVAFVVYTRHAGDAEWIVIQGDQLFFRRCHGGRWTQWQARVGWLRVGFAANGLVELKAADRCLQVGASASNGQRHRFVQELRGVLAAQAAAAV